MKIFVYSSSSNKNSTTKKLIDHVLGEIVDKTNEEIITYDWSGTILNYCKGCKQCFQLKECELDKSDSLSKMKKELKNSDLIILGTPIYANNINGAMKTFIDRISAWCHTFELQGKRGIIVTSTDNSGTATTNNYLFEIMSYLGICDIQILSYRKGFDTSKKINNTIFEISNSVSYYYNFKVIPSTNSFTENAFLSFQNVYKNIKTPESIYWLKHGLFDYASLQAKIKDDYYSVV